MSGYRSINDSESLHWNRNRLEKVLNFHILD